MDTVRDYLASRIRFLRKSKGVKQAALAEAVGCEVNTISRYEIGTSTPSVEQLLRLAEALGVSPIEFLPAQDDSLRRLTALRQELSEKIFQLDAMVFQMESIDELIELDRLVGSIISTRKLSKT